MEAMTSVEKAVDVLFHLNRMTEPVGVTQLGRALGLPKSSAHRLLAVLTRRGLVERDARGRYAPGVGLVALGLGAVDRDPLVSAARGVLQAEAAALEETVFLVASRSGALLVVDKAEGNGFLRASPRVGAEVPVHATAVGKLFLAFGDDPSIPGRLERFTEHTPTRRADLERAVAQARRDGTARSREEWIAGLSVVAAPIRVRGRMLGALALGASTPRLDAADPDVVTARIRRAAGEIAARLEGTRHD
jgi:DNA-binding IclR family transcriptional regulator